MDPLNEQLVEDAVLSRNVSDAAAAGMPAIHVSRNQGKLLYPIARISGARRILAIGTREVASLFNLRDTVTIPFQEAVSR